VEKQRMAVVYVLWSQKLAKRYVGISENASARLNQHNAGSNRFTKGGVPWVLLYTETYATRKEALRQERFLKSGVGRAWLDQHLG
jgi:putative endonuclease